MENLDCQKSLLTVTPMSEGYARLEGQGNSLLFSTSQDNLNYFSLEEDLPRLQSRPSAWNIIPIEQKRYFDRRGWIIFILVLIVVVVVLSVQLAYVTEQLGRAVHNSGNRTNEHLNGNSSDNGNSNDSPFKWSPPVDDNNPNRLPYSTIFYPNLAAERPFYKWLTGSQDVYLAKGTDGIYIEDIVSKKKQLFVPDSVKLPSHISWIVTADQRFILYPTDTKPVWRHSTIQKYSIYDRTLNKIYPLFDGYISVLEISHNSIAFVHDNNIFLTTADNQSLIQLTSDGNEYIMNGVADWVYEEDMLSSNQGLFWSTNGSVLAYLSFNDSLVPFYEYQEYKNYDYPESYKLRYPKPGHPNPFVKLTFYYNHTHIPLNVRADIISQVVWLNDSVCLVRVMNREQNESILYSVTIAPFKVTPVQFKYQDNGWIDNNDYLKVSGDSFVDLVNVNGLNQIFLYRGTSGVQITRGDHVEQIYEFVGDLIFFGTSSVENHIQSISVDGVDQGWDSKDATWNSIVQFSPSKSFFIRESKSLLVPFFHLVNIRDKSSHLLIDNKPLQQKLESIILPKTEYMTVLNRENVPLNVKVNYPTNFNHSLKYPLLLNVYGGPNSNLVTMRFTPPDWLTYLSANKGIITLQIDAHGTGRRGNDFKFKVYKQLGHYEVLDIIDVLNHFISQGFVHKIAIQGWSYGGYLAAKVVESGFVKIGVSVAPVTDWRWYDTFYTERYMGLEGSHYDDSAVGNYSAFLNTRFLLVHGTADDNVHFQHSAKLSMGLVDAGVVFWQRYFPDSAHSLGRGRDRESVWRNIVDFIIESFEQ